MTDIKGEVTPETILKQCRDMSNDNISADFTYMSKIKTVSILVIDNLNRNCLYSDLYHEDLESKSLAEILQDLIKIEHEYTGERNE